MICCHACETTLYWQKLQSLEFLRGSTGEQERLCACLLKRSVTWRVTWKKEWQDEAGITGLKHRVLAGLFGYLIKTGMRNIIVLLISSIITIHCYVIARNCVSRWWRKTHCEDDKQDEKMSFLRAVLQQFPVSKVKPWKQQTRSDVTTIETDFHVSREPLDKMASWAKKFSCLPLFVEALFVPSLCQWPLFSSLDSNGRDALINYHW